MQVKLNAATDNENEEVIIRIPFDEYPYFQHVVENGFLNGDRNILLEYLKIQEGKQ